MPTVTLDAKKEIWPPLPTMDELRAVEHEKIDRITKIGILSGFNHIVNGITYHFSYRTDDQTNFVQTNTQAMFHLQSGNRGSWSVTWQGYTDTGVDQLTFNASGFMELAKAANDHLNQKLAEGRSMKSSINEATDEDKLKELVSTLDLDNRLRLAEDLAQSKELFG